MNMAHWLIEAIFAVIAIAAGRSLFRDLTRHIGS